MNVSYNPTRVYERCKCCSPTLDIRPSHQLLCDDCWLGTLQQEGVLVDYLCNTDFEDGTNDLRDTETLKPVLSGKPVNMNPPKYINQGLVVVMDSYLKTAQISRSILILIVLFYISFLLQNLENKDVNLKAMYQSSMIL